MVFFKIKYVQIYAGGLYCKKKSQYKRLKFFWSDVKSSPNLCNHWLAQYDLLHKSDNLKKF